MDETLKRDQNFITVLGGITDNAAQNITMLRVDPITKRLLISATGLPGGGTVTSVSVVTANGVSGSVATATSTPAITLTLGAITPTSVNGASSTEIGYLVGVTSAIQTQLNSKGAGTVTSVSGTSNRITSTGGTTPVIDISATFEALLGKVANPLSQFASTTSAQLAGIISDETGSGSLVFATSPTFVTPLLGTPTSGVLTNCTGLPVASVVAGALANGMTATTQSANDNSTKLATTAYVDGKSTGAMTLLKANSGTSTSAGASNVDTISISGLTAKDVIVFYISCSSVTQSTAGAELYSSTDTVRLLQIGNGTMADGNFQGISGSMRQEQQSTKKVFSIGTNINAMNPDTDATGDVHTRSQTVTTDWTGSWTLALRQGGVTAGGTFRWAWSVYKIAGQ